MIGLPSDRRTCPPSRLRGAGRLLGAVLLALSCAAQAQPRLDAGYAFSNDSDGTTHHRLRSGVRKAVAGGDTVVGAGAGYWRIGEEVSSTDFALLDVGIEHRIDAQTAVFAETSLLQASEWTTGLGALRATHRFDLPLYLELSAAREIVDTEFAIDRRWEVYSYGASLDIGAFYGVTAVGAYTRQNIGDGNDRDVWVARLLYEMGERRHWLLQGRSRLLRSDFDAVGYFSPRKLDEHKLLLTYRRPVLGDRWFFSVEAGGGMQKVNRGEGQEIFSVDLVWRGWFNDHIGLESRGGCSNTGGFSGEQAGSGYRYCQGQVTLLWSW